MECDIDFDINSKIEIQVDNDDRYYKSNIQDLGEDYIGISLPVNNGKYLLLRKGDRIRCIYFREKKIYGFYTVVLDRKSDKILMIQIKKPDQVKLTQRRDFVRVPLINDVLCVLIPDSRDLKHLSCQINFFNANSLNISGGGMKLSVDMKYKNEIRLGSTLMVTIPIKDDNVTVKGKIVRIDKNTQNKLLICGITFLDLEEDSREKIIKLVFDIMRKQIKKGEVEE